MPIKRLEPFRPIKGDDLGRWTARLADVPAGFHFTDLRTPDAVKYPNTFAVWIQMCEFAERWYADWEIVGVTYADFFRQLQLAYDRNADTFERLMAVYDDDIAKPILGRTEVTDYGDLTDKRTTISTPGAKITTSNIDNPTVGAEDLTPTSLSVTAPEGKDQVTDENKRTGKVTVTLSDLGVRPNYESLNGFLDNNRTAASVWVDMFRDCFTIFEVMSW